MKKAILSVSTVLLFGFSSLPAMANESEQDIRQALSEIMTQNIAQIEATRVETDLDSALAKIETRLLTDQVVEDAVSDLPKNRFRVVIAD